MGDDTGGKPKHTPRTMYNKITTPVTDTKQSNTPSGPLPGKGNKRHPYPLGRKTGKDPTAPPKIAKTYPSKNNLPKDILPLWNPRNFAIHEAMGRLNGLEINTSLELITKQKSKRTAHEKKTHAPTAPVRRNDHERPPGV